MIYIIKSCYRALLRPLVRVSLYFGIRISDNLIGLSCDFDEFTSKSESPWCQAVSIITYSLDIAYPNGLSIQRVVFEPM